MRCVPTSPPNWNATAMGGRSRHPQRGPGATTRGGWGARHQALRKTLAPIVAAGGVICWRCGDPIGPGEPWDLGHRDGSRTEYEGPEHRACNRATAGRAAAQRQTRDPQPKTMTRW